MSSSRVGFLVVLLAAAAPASANPGEDCREDCTPPLEVVVTVDYGRNSTSGAYEVQVTQQASVDVAFVEAGTTYDSHQMWQETEAQCRPVSISGGQPRMSVFPDVLGIAYVDTRCVGLVVRGP